MYFHLDTFRSQVKNFIEQADILPPHPHAGSSDADRALTESPRVEQKPDCALEMMFIIIINSQSLMSCFCVLDTMQNTVPLLCYLVFTTTQQDRYIYGWGNWGSDRLTNLPKVTPLVKQWSQDLNLGFPFSKAHAILPNLSPPVSHCPGGVM